jgi:hypothetical protein
VLAWYDMVALVGLVCRCKGCRWDNRIQDDKLLHFDSHLRGESSFWLLQLIGSKSKDLGASGGRELGVEVIIQQGDEGSFTAVVRE